MSTEVWIRTLQVLLQEGKMPRSKISKSIRKSPAYQQHISAGVIVERRSGPGYEVVLVDRKGLETYYKKRFPNADEEVAFPTGITNNLRTRDSKSGIRTDQRATYFIRGWHSVELASEPFDLKNFTERFEALGLSNQSLSCERLCLVENQDVFFRAEEILGHNFTFVHPYGRAGESLFKLFTSKKYYHWPDYDFTGLDEFLRFRKTHSGVRLILPEPLEELWLSHGRSRKRKDKMSKEVRNSTLQNIVRVRELLKGTNRFLEQQVCFAEAANVVIDSDQTQAR